MTPEERLRKTEALRGLLSELAAEQHRLYAEFAAGISSARAQLRPDEALWTGNEELLLNVTNLLEGDSFDLFEEGAPITLNSVPTSVWEGERGVEDWVLDRLREWAKTADRQQSARRRKYLELKQEFEPEEEKTDG